MDRHRNSVPREGPPGTGAPGETSPEATNHDERRPGATVTSTDTIIVEPSAHRLEPRAARPFAGARASRLVAAMKMLLPAIALCLVALVVIWPQLLRDPGEVVLRGERLTDWKSIAYGRSVAVSVDHGGRRSIKNKKKQT